MVYNIFILWGFYFCIQYILIMLSLSPSDSSQSEVFNIFYNYLFCMYMCACMCSMPYMCGDQRRTCLSQLFLPVMWSQDGTQFVRHGNDCLYSLSYLGCPILLFFFKVMYKCPSSVSSSVLGIVII